MRNTNLWIVTFFFWLGLSVSACGTDDETKLSEFGGGFVAGKDDVCGGGAANCDGDVNDVAGDAADGFSQADDSGEGPGGETTVEDGTAVEDVSDGPDTVSSPDVGTADDTQVPPSNDGGIGSACTIDMDCVDDGAVCVEWPAGSSFCTLLDCEQGIACPVGSVCIPLTVTTWGCAPTCEKGGDCRSGYPCKTLLQENGSLVSVCHGVDSKAGGPASLCDVAMECKGNAACISDWPGGYCAVLGCSPSKPCPSDAACIPAEGVGNACLKICDETKPCPGTIVDFQHCGPIASLDGGEVTVCLIGETGKDLGEFCTADNECLSGDCKITALGKCANDGKSCMDGEDCDGGAPCELNPDFILGTCMESCDAQKACPDGTICVPNSKTKGECRTQCQSLADNFTCDKFTNELCVYGIPLNGIADAGEYACVQVPPGVAGEECIGDLGLGCVEGLYCYPGSGAAGMCVTGCGGLTPGGVSFCPWSTACASVASTTQCMKLCPSGDIQCPNGFECKSLVFGVPTPLDVCAPL